MRATDERDFVIVADQVVIGEGREVIRDGALVVHNGRVAWCGTRAGLATTSPTVERYPSCTVLPGFVDAHVHLGLDAGADPAAQFMSASDESLHALMTANARKLLMAGVTSVRDLGTRRGHGVRLREELAAHVGAYPRVLTADSPITAPGGHCWFMGGECPPSMRDAVEERAKLGVDWIKIMVTGGFITANSVPSDTQFDLPDVAAAVEEAHRHGLRVAAHAHSPAGIRMAAEARADSIEHCTWFEDGRLSFDRKLAELVAEHGIAVCPTLSGHARRNDGVVPWRRRREHLRRMRELGIELIAGTDAGIRATPPEAYASSLLPLQDIGMNALEVIELATFKTAQALGIGDVTGSLTPGKDCDAVIVRGDPLANLDYLSNVVAVLRRGILTPVEEGNAT
jgi:imidazolonepropionase-like amidohydrolase